MVNREAIAGACQIERFIDIIKLMLMEEFKWILK